MKYAKPELIAIAQAASAIHGEPKKSGITSDNDNGYLTISAYEADE